MLAINSFDEKELLKLAASAERRSERPIQKIYGVEIALSHKNYSPGKPIIEFSHTWLSGG